MAKRVTSCREYFDTLQERFIPEKADGVDGTFLYQLEGDGGGTWNLTVRDKTLTVNSGSIDSPNVTYRISAADYVNLANGDLGGVKAVLTRKLKVSGSIPLAKKMSEFLPPGDK